jgi:hypothetical protein
MTASPDNLPTARSTLPNASWLYLHVSAVPAPPGASGLTNHIDAVQGHRPLKDLKFRCAKCGSRRTEAVMMGKGGVGVRPWRAEAR